MTEFNNWDIVGPKDPMENLCEFDTVFGVVRDSIVAANGEAHIGVIWAGYGGMWLRYHHHGLLTHYDTASHDAHREKVTKQGEDD